MHCKNFSKNRYDKRAVSPAISMVIITAATIVLVLVTSSYAYQVLERQQASAEFNAVQKSFISFHDAVRDVAWDRGGSRVARFTVNSGSLELLPSGTLEIKVKNESNIVLAAYSCETAFIRYTLPTKYLTFGEGYEYYIIGNNESFVTSSSSTFGQALIKQEGSFVNITLNYGIQVLTSSPPTLINGVPVSYVDILVIKIGIPKRTAYVGEFDLTARNLNIITYASYVVNQQGNWTVTARLGEIEDTVNLKLAQGNAVINFVIAEVQVST